MTRGGPMSSLGTLASRHTVTVPATTVPTRTVTVATVTKLQEITDDARLKKMQGRDMAVRNFPKCEVGRSVGRSVVGPQYIHCSHVLLFATLGT